MISKYIHYLKYSQADIQRFHVALWSGIATGVFAFIYIGILYDTTRIPFFNKINNQVAYVATTTEKEDTFENSSESPFEIFMNLFQETKDKIKASSSSMNSVEELFSHKNVYKTSTSTQ